MARGDIEYAALIEAMDHTRAGCKGDPRFIRDDLTADDEREMARICAACPLADLCKTAVKAMPYPAGYWAGRQYGTPTKGKK